MPARKNKREQVKPRHLVKPTEKEGSISGFEPRDIRRSDKDIIGIDDWKYLAGEDLDPDSDWFDEDLASRRSRFLCVGCKVLLTYQRNGTYLCMNNECTSYLCPADPFYQKLPQEKEREMSIAGQLSGEDQDCFVSYNPDSQEFTGTAQREVTFKSADSRIQHLKYRSFPRNLSLKANTED